jgi:uncharacterized membrane protein
MPNENDVMVVAYYVNDDVAHGAAEALKKWDDANDAIELGAIAVLTVNPNTGELEAQDVGQRNTKKGALWGTAIGAAVGILSGGIALIPGMILGAGGGAAIGAMDHKGIGMTDEDRERMAENLRRGGAALAVMADDFEVEATKEELARGGGVVEAYDVPDETADIIGMAAAAQLAASEAVDEAVAEDAELVEEAERTVAVQLPQQSSKNAAIVAGILATTELTAEDAAKAREAGIDKPSKLLEMAATPEGRQELAEITGIAPEKILVAVKLLDLMRVKGVGIKNSRLLLATGVDTVPELAQRNPKNLRASMEKANATEEIVGMVPYEVTVTEWVDQAKTLPRIVTY